MRRLLQITTLLIFCVCIYLGYLYFRDDGSSKTIVEAIEKARRDGFVNYIIDQFSVEDGEVVFYLRNINEGHFSVAAEFVKKTRRGWIWGYGGALSGSQIRLDLTENEAKKLSFQSNYFQSTKGSEFIDSPFPMVYGISFNPEVSRIVIRDYVTGLQKQATVVEITSTLKLFYSLLGEEQGKRFDLVGYNIKGDQIVIETIDENVLSSTYTGNIR